MRAQCRAHKIKNKIGAVAKQRPHRARVKNCRALPGPQTLCPFHADFNIRITDFRLEGLELATEEDVVRIVPCSASKTSPMLTQALNGQWAVEVSRWSIASSCMIFGVSHSRRQDPMRGYNSQSRCVQVGLTGHRARSQLLQFPSTASSGRKLIIVIFGARIAFFRDAHPHSS